MKYLNRHDTEEVLYYTLEKCLYDRMQIADGVWNNPRGYSNYYLNPISITRWGHKHGFKVTRVRHKELWEFNKYGQCGWSGHR